MSSRNSKRPGLHKNREDKTNDSYVLSYNYLKWMLSWSPWYSLEDWRKLKNDDGAEACLPMKLMLYNAHSVKTSLGEQVYPDAVFKRSYEREISALQFFLDGNKLHDAYALVRVTTMMWPHVFAVPAFIQNMQDPCFAMAYPNMDFSVELRSPLYHIHSDFFEEIAFSMREKDILFPFWHINIDGNEYKVFLFSHEVLSYLVNANNFPNVRLHTYITDIELKRYLDILNGSAQSGSDDELEILRLKYDKQCESSLTALETIFDKIHKMSIEPETAEQSQQIQRLPEEIRSHITQAETMFEKHKADKSIDFSPVVIEYCKALEVAYYQYKIAANIPYVPTYQVLREISQTCDEKLKPYINDLFEINTVRNKAAHIGKCSVKDVEFVKSKIIDMDMIGKILNIIKTVSEKK